VIRIETKLRAADNAGGILFRCIRIKGGFKRRYAGLGEMVVVVSSTRKVYRKQTNKEKLAKLAKKVKKKRKIKARKKRQPSLRPYLGLLVSIRKSTNRRDGSYIKHDKNRIWTYTEPTKFGPAGKTENIPNLVGTKTVGPACLELVKNKSIRTKFQSVVKRCGGIA